ncbi:Uncharacterized RNA-binding protein [Sparassis crispa]|uniref:Uncharacterized RNA-binding protein n=1 Tax=Sparassis crispa TaxID=139825 RepID=A0A401GA58_9APHY|nr:Uncharacterized RNA-binding protein [Sparassis crispa]GBE79052.1 Uncharacterized RNA-binding protein [Sparassis crispa]
MSDLDADLYGDLYGNDESEFTVPMEQPEENGKSDTAESPRKEAPAPAKAEAPPTKVAQTTTSTESSSQPSHASITPTAIPPYTSPPTQQIPTYQDRLTPEYREPPPARQDVGYQPPIDRPVRPSEMKEEGKMFIGGLNWDTTDEGLREYFSQFGKVEACTIMRDAAGRSRCFAFLTFEDPASVNAVMVREHFLDGKIIDPKRAIPRQEHQRATKLFIGGLAGSVTSESMREFFSQFGKVVDATVMLDRETGRSKGFGFVSFENVNVESFLGFGNLEIDGKLIDVKLAQPRSQRESYAEGGPVGNAGRGYNGGGYSTQEGYGGASGPTGAGATNTHFDPQALASLYTRMIQQMGGMNPMMAGGMNPMMAGMAGGMGGGMRMPGMGGSPMAGMGMGGGMNGGGMGRGGAGAGGPSGGVMQGGMGPNVPRGPRGASAGAGAGQSGVGPQRAGQRGQHNYHPYAR